MSPFSRCFCQNRIEMFFIRAPSFSRYSLCFLRCSLQTIPLNLSRGQRSSFRTASESYSTLSLSGLHGYSVKKCRFSVWEKRTKLSGAAQVVADIIILAVLFPWKQPDQGTYFTWSQLTSSNLNFNVYFESPAESCESTYAVHRMHKQPDHSWTRTFGNGCSNRYSIPAACVGKKLQASRTGHAS